MKYAALHPKKVKKLIIVSAPLSDHSKKPPLLWKLAIKYAIVTYIENNNELLKDLLKILLPGRNINKTANTAHSLLKNLPVKSIATCYHDLLVLSFKKYVEKIKVPTLIIHGTRDDVLAEFGGTALYPFFPFALTIPIESEHFIPSQKPDELSNLSLGFISNKQINLHR